jgi:hypothetical protein
MKYQRGFGLGQLITWGVVIVFVALLGMKLFPSVLEYYTIVKDIKATAAAATPESTVSQVRAAFSRYADIDQIKRIEPTDLEIYKENDKVVIAFEYADKLKLFGPVSLLIEYSGSSADN